MFLRIDTLKASHDIWQQKKKKSALQNELSLKIWLSNLTKNP